MIRPLEIQNALSVSPLRIPFLDPRVCFGVCVHPMICARQTDRSIVAKHNLNTYLQDHIAGAEVAVIVIDVLNKHAEEPHLIRILEELQIEVTKDKAVLERVAASLQSGPNVLKNTVAWMTAQIVDLKVRVGKTPFGAFEGLEFLALGIQGKLHLWKALQRSAGCASATYTPDYLMLIERAEAQHRRVEDLRLALASIVL